jgi:hypothetical protein
MNKITQRSIIQGNDELTLSFYLLTKDMAKNDKIISFSRLLWPILSIQGVLSTHIMLDGLNIFKKSDKFSNPPRQPLIGHILRNIENRTKIEELNKLIEILTYKDLEAEEIGEGEESEYHTLKINGLINPEFLNTLLSIIPLIEYKPIVDYTVLDHSITTEMALTISENYREIVNLMKGNAYRWKSQTELIEKEVGKWLIDVNVQLKDLETRFSSQINKASSTIDPTQMDYQVKLEQDKIDQWSVEEKKKLIESISTLFKTAERSLEEVIKKNKFFVSGDSLKSRVFEDVIPHFQNHFNYLKSEGQKFTESLESLNKRFIEIKDKAILIDDDANSRIKEFKESLNLKLKDRDKLLTEFQSEKQKKISELVILKEKIESLFKNIKDVIDYKHRLCLQESQELINWSLNDNQSELFSRPIQWIYMPIYIMFIENDNTMEESMNVLFPGYITNNPDNIYDFISESFMNLKDKLSEIIEDNMAIRSNFEFSSESKNLMKDTSLQKRIQLGLSKLKEKSLINENIERIIRENLNLLQ